APLHRPMQARRLSEEPRLRRSARVLTTMKARNRRSMDDPVLPQMQFAKLPVGIGMLDGQRAGGLGPAASHFGQRIFETVGQIDAAAIFLTRNRIDDRLAA